LTALAGDRPASAAALVQSMATAFRGRRRASSMGNGATNMLDVRKSFAGQNQGMPTLDFQEQKGSL